MQQIFTNLINNAFKFTTNGTIEAGVTLLDHNFRFHVKDTGVGISPENQKAVFERFVQVGSTSKMAGGTGLGLAIVKGLIEMLGGTIWVESEPGRGATFFFEFSGNSLLRDKQHNPTLSEIATLDQ